jgi:hypothetical protein
MQRSLVLRMGWPVVLAGGWAACGGSVHTTTTGTGGSTTGTGGSTTGPSSSISASGNSSASGSSSGSVSGSGSSSSGGEVCIPGQQVACGCVGGGVGVQVCNATGTGLGPCTGCPSSSSSASGSSSGSSSSGGPLSGPPTPGPVKAPNGTSDVTFAIQKLYLGDTDPNGTPDMTNGWMYYGYNIDGVPAGNPSAFCQPVDNASPTLVHQEGPGGVENAWAHLILPIIFAIDANASTTLNNQITSGSFTQLFTIGKLGSDADYNPIASQLAQGGNLMATPKFDGTDAWPVVQGSTISLPSAYVTGNTWVSGAPATLTLPFGSSGSSSFTGLFLPLSINHAVVTMQMDATHTHATGGIISGVIPTAAFVQQIMLVAGNIDPSLCSGATIDSITAQISQASDIMQDGTQDPTQTCDGISIGLGFDAAADQLGPTVPAPTPPANPCADGG